MQNTARISLPLILRILLNSIISGGNLTEKTWYFLIAQFINPLKTICYIEKSLQK